MSLCEIDEQANGKRYNSTGNQLPDMDGTPDDNFSLSSVFSQSYFVIPNYQRDYAWEESNVDDLLDDVDFIYRENNNDERDDRLNHYFGTLVLEERGSVEPTDFEDYDVFGIVDGQQRLATVAIVISSIIDECLLLKEAPKLVVIFLQQSAIGKRISGKNTFSMKT